MCAIGGGPCLEVVAATTRFDDDKHNRGNGLRGGLIKGEGASILLIKIVRYASSIRTFPIAITSINNNGNWGCSVARGCAACCALTIEQPH
uniref:Uncharacterized protein n=1 Tax=Oryza meridionalis TaxID=40149 RepID=A0A0E0EIB3_9ORYZ